MPPQVAEVYLAHTDALPLRDCEDCGYGGPTSTSSNALSAEAGLAGTHTGTGTRTAQGPTDEPPLDPPNDSGEAAQATEGDARRLRSALRRRIRQDQRRACEEHEDCVFQATPLPGRLRRMIIGHWYEGMTDLSLG